MRNVYFNMDYVQKALKIVEESHELRDAANDVRKVKEAFSNCLPRRQSTGMASTSVTECEE